MNYLIHHSIERHSQDHPDAEAFRYRGDSIDYQALHQRSARLANMLLELGSKPMERIGILMTKCLELPVSVYGILMAGAAYVPIDPRSSPERIRFILRDCGIRFLLTTDSRTSFLAKLLEQGDSPLTHIIGSSLDSFGTSINGKSWEQVSQAKSTPPTIDTRETDLAYVMYTSGSTGVPKGLMHTHQSGLAYAKHSQALYSVSPHDILGNHAPLHFDISTFEFLTGPYAGATTVLIPDEDMLFPAAIANSIESDRLSFWYSVPLALIQMLNPGHLSDTDTTSLRWVLFGGEPFPPKYLRQLMETIPTARFCNVYGPAEVNQCSYYHLPEKLDQVDHDIPIGQIWPGARGKLIDADDNVVSGLAPGELVVESPTMMKGYWNRPDLNEAAYYREEPFPGFSRRFYRTGDVMRYDEEGQLHFLGRKDRQIKLRGYRVELDEIEAVFTSNPNIELAACVTCISEMKEKEIVVFITLQTQGTLDEREVRSWARARLPHYALPSKIIVRETFPRTTSGKIDRKQLEDEYPSEQVISFHSR